MCFLHFPESHQQEQELPAGQPLLDQTGLIWRRYNEDQ